MSSYTIKAPSDIFSLVMSVYGTLQQSCKLVSDNSAFIPSLNSDISSLAGQALVYDTALVKSTLPPVSVIPTPPSPVTQYSWTGREGQSIFDVCIQTYGILDNQIKLMNDNNIDFSAQVFAQPYAYNSSMIANSSIWNRTTGVGVVFSSGS